VSKVSPEGARLLGLSLKRPSAARPGSRSRSLGGTRWPGYTTRRGAPVPTTSASKGRAHTLRRAGTCPSSARLRLCCCGAPPWTCTTPRSQLSHHSPPAPSLAMSPLHPPVPSLGFAGLPHVLCSMDPCESKRSVRISEHYSCRKSMIRRRAASKWTMAGSLAADRWLVFSPGAEPRPVCCCNKSMLLAACALVDEQAALFHLVSPDVPDQWKTREFWNTACAALCSS
jgi:hypothetical protein